MPPELQPPPLGLYVHLPWCVRKCPYCDFNSHALTGELPAGEYLAALLRDLEQDLPRVWGRTVSSIYFGGGTPSLFSAAQIESLVAGIRARLPVSPGAEITLEANPGTIEYDSFSAYRQAGVNRVSLGVQSFDDGLLESIGRIHGRGEVEAAISSLRDSGLRNFNIDIMYGLPGQSVAQAVADVNAAIEAGPAHISWYHLTLEPNTAFAANPPALPADETCWEIQDAGGKLLRSSGLEQYEVSAWAGLQQRSAHNLNYWQFGDYLGIGAGAHSKLSDAVQGKVCRLVKHRHPRQFMRDPAVVEEKEVGERELAFEYFLNVLRLTDGFKRDHFRKRTGLAWASVSGQLDSALGRGLLEPIDGGYRPTDLGWRFMNDLQAVFLP